MHYHSPHRGRDAYGASRSHVAYSPGFRSEWHRCASANRVDPPLGPVCTSIIGAPNRGRGSVTCVRRSGTGAVGNTGQVRDCRPRDCHSGAAFGYQLVDRYRPPVRDGALDRRLSVRCAVDRRRSGDRVADRLSSGTASAGPGPYGATPRRRECDGNSSRTAARGDRRRNPRDQDHRRSNRSSSGPSGIGVSSRPVPRARYRSERRHSIP